MMRFTDKRARAVLKVATLPEHLCLALKSCMSGMSFKTFNVEPDGVVHLLFERPDGAFHSFFLPNEYCRIVTPTRPAGAGIKVSLLLENLFTNYPLYWELFGL